MNNQTPKKAIVIGGGIGGLTAAFNLTQSDAPYQVTLLEAKPQLGGSIQSGTESGCTLEFGADSLIQTKPAARALAKSVGIADDDIISTRPEARTCYIVHKAQLHPIPEGFYLMVPGQLGPWIKTPLISLRGKLRVLMDLFLPRGPQGDESLASFVRRRLGSEVLERLAQPLVAGIYGADPEQLSLQSTMPQFPNLEKEHRSLLLGLRAQQSRMATKGSSGARYSLFYSFKGGLQRLPDAVIAAISPHVDIQLDTQAATVERSDGRQWRVTTTTGTCHEADVLIMAVPAWQAAVLLKNCAPDIATTLRDIPYGSVATINLGYHREQIAKLPDASGFVVPRAESDSIIACTFAHQKYPNRAPEDLVVLRAFAGGSGREAVLNDDDQALTRRVTGELSAWLNIEGEPAFVRLNRYNKCMAQYTLGHKERLAQIRSIEKTHTGLALIGNAYEGIGIPDVIQQANDAIERL
ncbi:MAG: protoporphyrinogen oxidase, partial [Kiritimatiellae bacterium]|nr:protoporphyrinogen oxidase [Kiritimatiellia bacterium]